MHTQQLSIDPDALLTETQAAEMLQLSTRTLQAWRVRGGDLIFIRAGRAIRYRRGDLLDWIKTNSATSTSAADASR